MSGCLIHLVDPAKALSEMTRVTKIWRLDGRIGTRCGGRCRVDASRDRRQNERYVARFFTARERTTVTQDGNCIACANSKGWVDLSGPDVRLHFTDYAFAREMWLMDEIERKAAGFGCPYSPGT